MQGNKKSFPMRKLFCDPVKELAIQEQVKTECRTSSEGNEGRNGQDCQLVPSYRKFAWRIQLPADFSHEQEETLFPKTESQIHKFEKAKEENTQYKKSFPVRKLFCDSVKALAIQEQVKTECRTSSEGNEGRNG